MQDLPPVPEGGTLIGLILVALILYRRPILESLRATARDDSGQVVAELRKIEAGIAAMRGQLEKIHMEIVKVHEEQLRVKYGRHGE